MGHSHRADRRPHVRRAAAGPRRTTSVHYTSGTSDWPSDTECEEWVTATGPTDDHTYGARQQDHDEPPAFIIHQNKMRVEQLTNVIPIAPKIMTIAPGYPSLNLIQVADQSLDASRPGSTSQPPAEYNINKRIRRSEVVLRAAADCVSRGLTFQTVSEQFNIPISTIRFFMARKGILPRRRRGRSTQVVQTSSSPEPPFHMQHYKLPNMLALKADDDEQNA